MPRNNEHDANLQLQRCYTPANYRMGFDRNLFTARRTSRIVPVIVTILAAALIGVLLAWRG